jgi:hypothetical protein
MDPRLVRDGHFDHLDVYASALYQFLITVADARGLIRYEDTSMARRLSMDEIRLRHARGDLIRAGLLAPLFEQEKAQLLPLNSATYDIARIISSVRVR